MFIFRLHSPFPMFLNDFFLNKTLFHLSNMPVSLQESEVPTLLSSVAAQRVLHAEVEGNLRQLAQTRNVVILLQHTKSINICFLPYL